MAKTMMEYNKLVRDRIPELICKQGEIPMTRVLDEAEFVKCLEYKLDEEVAEYHESGNLEELADILEVLYALCEVRGNTLEELMQVYSTKHEARGGFAKRIFLIGKC